MKIYRTLLASLLLCSSASVMADTGVFVGVVYDFGAKPEFGFSAKLVSDDKTDRAVGVLGISYFPAAEYKLGADVGLGYTFDNGLVTASYDIFNKAPQLGLGYMKTED